MRFDNSISTPQERVDCIKGIIDSNAPSQKELGYMSDYILFVADKDQTKKEKKESHSILTKNRAVTINKRQVSLDGMISDTETGEETLHALMRKDKSLIMDPKETISKRDLEEIPGMVENMRVIESLKRQFDKATGKQRFSLKKQIISKYQEQYILKASYRGIPAKGRISNQVRNMAHMPLDENITIDEKGIPHSDCVISLLNPVHISFLLCHYTQLKQECADDLQSDMHFLLLDLENLVKQTFLPQNEVLYDILCWKVDGYTNEELADLIEEKHGVRHSEQYFSTIWRNKIPRAISFQAQKNYINWYYFNEEYGEWKTCGKCGKTKLAHPFYFSRNTSNDGWYSICKECRGR